MTSIELKVIAVLVLLAGLALGVVTGVQRIKADGAAQCQASVAAAAQQAAADQALRSDRAATEYETQKARDAQALVTARTDLRNALQRPIFPPGGPAEADHVQTLADLPIPASAVERLRRAAGGDGSADNTTAR